MKEFFLCAVIIVFGLYCAIVCFAIILAVLITDAARSSFRLHPSSFLP
jgi:hypothetical protein